jgi:hypothetical protein
LTIPSSTGYNTAIFPHTIIKIFAASVSHVNISKAYSTNSFWIIFLNHYFFNITVRLQFFFEIFLEFD